MSISIPIQLQLLENLKKSKNYITNQLKYGT